MDGMGAVTPARVAEERNRISAQGLTEEEEKLHKDVASGAKRQEITAQRQFNGFSPIEGDAQSKAIADTRLAPTWDVADVRKPAKARLVAKGYQARLRRRAMWILRDASAGDRHIYR